MQVIRSGLVTPVWCTSWRHDASTLIGPLLGLPPLPFVDLPRPQITTSHPNRYLWKRGHVGVWLNDTPVTGSRRLHQRRPRMGHQTHRLRPDNRIDPARPSCRPPGRAPGRGSGADRAVAHRIGCRLRRLIQSGSRLVLGSSDGVHISAPQSAGWRCGSAPDPGVGTGVELAGCKGGGVFDVVAVGE